MGQAVLYTLPRTRLPGPGVGIVPCLASGFPPPAPWERNWQQPGSRVDVFDQEASLPGPPTSSHPPSIPPGPVAAEAPGLRAEIPPCQARAQINDCGTSEVGPARTLRLPRGLRSHPGRSASVKESCSELLPPKSASER